MLWNVMQHFLHQMSENVFVSFFAKPRKMLIRQSYFSLLSASFFICCMSISLRVPLLSFSLTGHAQIQQCIKRTIIYLQTKTNNPLPSWPSPSVVELPTVFAAPLVDRVFPFAAPNPGSGADNALKITNCLAAKSDRTPCQNNGDQQRSKQIIGSSK